MKFSTKEELMKWALGSQNLWIFLDYDGTFADFAPTPAVVESNPKVVSLLERLVQLPNIRVTIISGRRLRDLNRLLPIKGIFLAGTYGVELHETTGELVQRVEYDRIRPVMEAIKPQWEQIIYGRRGFFLEDKDWSLALYARFADEHEAEQVLNQARQVARGYLLKGYSRIVGGHQFLEIAPMLASKRETIAYLLSHYPLSDVRLLYIGDDDKDEEIFRMLHARHGMAVKVRQPCQAPRPTEADFFFASPTDTLCWLAGLTKLNRSQD